MTSEKSFVLKPNKIQLFIWFLRFNIKFCAECRYIQYMVIDGHEQMKLINRGD